MKHRVVVTARAKADIDRFYLWLHAQAPEGALRWYEEVLGKIASLERFPARCPKAPEAGAVGTPIRHALCGDYRIIFIVDRRRVVVLHVRHGRQRPLKSGDFGRPRS